MSNRLIGQDVVLQIIEAGELVNVAEIKEATITWKLDTAQEGYLGQTTDQFDAVFKGMEVKLTANLTRPTLIDLADRVVTRARVRSGPTSKINIVGLFLFPDGEVRSCQVPDIAFQDIPLSAGGRGEFVTVELTGMASEYKLL